MFWQALKAFHWVGKETDHAGLPGQQRCVISEVVERFPTPSITLISLCFQEQRCSPWCWWAMLYRNAQTSGGEGRGRKIMTWLVTTKHQALCWVFHKHFVFKSNYLSCRGKKSSSEKLNNLEKGIEPVSVDLEFNLRSVWLKTTFMLLIYEVISHPLGLHIFVSNFPSDH